MFTPDEIHYLLEGLKHEKQKKLDRLDQFEAGSKQSLIWTKEQREKYEVLSEGTRQDLGTIENLINKLGKMEK
ncbi:hypothetical protein [Alkalicoccobacillus gibsonii]|uniref:hypothetical protein n=1 Tax=Alkalicoccobacillus gibsonii TaxID=79881 RepID=UPI0035164ED3